MRLPRERFDSSPITSRRPWTPPEGARIAVWTIVNIEEWDIEKPMARQDLTAPQDVSTVPDVRKDQFDRLYAEGARYPRVMAPAAHPYISGVPHRIKHFEAVYDSMRKKKGVWFTAGEDIYEWSRTSR